MTIGKLPPGDSSSSGGGGVRIAPDADDVIVWLLNEAGAPWVNTGTGGAANLALGAGAVQTEQAGVVAPNSILFPSNEVALANSYLVGGGGVVLDVDNFSMSCWIKTNTIRAAAQDYRVITLPVPGAVGPFIYMLSLVLVSDPAANDRPTILYAECTTTGSSYTYLPTNMRVAPGSWHHIGTTWDSATGLQKIYFDGCLAAVNPVAYTGTLDNGGGGIDLNIGGSSEEPTFWYEGQIQDVRIANTTRDLAYFKQIYRAAFGLAQ